MQQNDFVHFPQQLFYNKLFSVSKDFDNRQCS